jgi:hypothetical protein
MTLTYVKPECREHKRKCLDAETRANRWLADGNELSDEAFASRDEPTRSARLYKKSADCYAKAQFWLDRFNKLTGRA